MLRLVDRDSRNSCLKTYDFIPCTRNNFELVGSDDFESPDLYPFLFFGRYSISQEDVFIKLREIFERTTNWSNDVVNLIPKRESSLIEKLSRFDGEAFDYLEDLIDNVSSERKVDFLDKYGLDPIKRINTLSIQYAVLPDAVGDDLLNSRSNKTSKLQIDDLLESSNLIGSDVGRLLSIRFHLDDSGKFTSNLKQGYRKLVNFKVRGAFSFSVDTFNGYLYDSNKINYFLETIFNYLSVRNNFESISDIADDVLNSLASHYFAEFVDITSQVFEFDD